MVAMSVRGVLVAAALGGAAGDLIVSPPCAQGADCGGQVWNDCGTACPLTCGVDLSALACTMQCVAEFQCQVGACFLEEAGECFEQAAGVCAQAVAGASGGIGAFVPQCEADGSYSPLQMHGSTGYSWCVDDQGAELTTRVGPGGAVGETAASCAAVRLSQKGAAAPSPTPVELVVTPPPAMLGGPMQPIGGDDGETEEQKLGLVFVLSLLTLIVLPVVLYCALKKACSERMDETGARTSLVGEDSSNRGETASDLSAA